MPIRLVLADDHPIVRYGLERLLAETREFTVCASCEDGASALDAVRRHQPDILLLDIRMPRMDGLEVLRQMHREGMATRVVILTGALDEDEVLEAIRLGVRGVVLKEMAPPLLLQCLRKVHAGGEWLEKDSVGRALEKLLQRESEYRGAACQLTPREIDLVKAVATGMSNAEIGAKLYISQGTVKVHLHRIYDKLQIKSRVALTLYAKEKGLA